MPTWKIATLALHMALTSLAGCVPVAPSPQGADEFDGGALDSTAESRATQVESTSQAMMDDGRDPRLPGGCHSFIECLVTGGGGGPSSSSGGGGGGWGGGVIRCKDQCVARYGTCVNRCPRPGPDDLLDCYFDCALERDDCIARCP